MNLIEVRDLSFSYRTQSGVSIPVLRNINLDIESGDLVAIQGPSGSGKSTLLYLLGCLLSGYTGTINVQGRDLSQLNDEELSLLRNRTIGFVFQQFNLLAKANVIENVLLPSQYPSENPCEEKAERRALALVKELGLEDRVHHYPNQLSGGQQQRVSIARALLNETQIILADEPTGSLDSINSQQILELLKLAHQSGRTVIIITHDSEISAQCKKIIYFKDGAIQEVVKVKPKITSFESSKLKKVEINPLLQMRNLNFSDNSDWIHEIQKKDSNSTRNILGYHKIKKVIRVIKSIFPLARESLKQNRSRTLLTMLGITIGVAAVLSMVTIGSFTKRKILESYEEMGVNTIVLRGYPNWELRAIDQVPVVFQSFDWEKDLLPLKKIFSEVQRLSPTLHARDGAVTFAGVTIDNDIRISGVSEEGLELANRSLALGNNFSPYHLENRSAVCIIGMEIYEQLFSNRNPLGEIVYVNQSENSFGCRIIGVLTSQTTNKDWNKPNLQLYLPYTFFQGISDPWSSRIRDVVLEVKSGSDIEEVGKEVKAYFNMKYGKSANFYLGSDSVLIAQMKRFLSLFTVLLGAIALVSLGVGGIGITNMMLVSVSERLKEIGVRKAFGATSLSIRTQYLVESLLVCTFAGVIGLLLGFILYESAIYGATKFVNKLKFEWTYDLVALLLSISSIFIVGILSGITPARKAEKLQVIEALRSE